MKKWTSIFFKFFSAILTFGVFYLILSSLVFTDFSWSLEPGWHTTIYPFGGKLEFTAVIAFCTLVFHLIFKITYKILNRIWLKVVNHKNEP